MHTVDDDERCREAEDGESGSTLDRNESMQNGFIIERSQTNHYSTF